MHVTMLHELPRIVYSTSCASLAALFFCAGCGGDDVRLIEPVPGETTYAPPAVVVPPVRGGSAPERELAEELLRRLGPRTIGSVEVRGPVAGRTLVATAAYPQAAHRFQWEWRMLFGAQRALAAERGLPPLVAYEPREHGVVLGPPLPVYLAVADDASDGLVFEYESTFRVTRATWSIRADLRG
jgi:hypothetical protein